MNIQRLKETLINKSPSFILNYLSEHNLNEKNWFNKTDDNETLFFKLFFKDYELGSTLLNSYYPSMQDMTYHSLMTEPSEPCYINHYLTPIINDISLMDYLVVIQTSNHTYSPEHLNVLGTFSQGFKTLCGITVDASRESLSFYNTFFKSFIQNPQDFKIHELIRQVNESCYLYDNTTSLFTHYFKLAEIQEFKETNHWNKITAFIPLISVFCKFQDIVNKDTQEEMRDKHLTFLYQKLETQLKLENCLTNQDWDIYHELKESSYQTYENRYIFSLSKYAIHTKPYQLLNDTIAYNAIKQYNTEKLESLCLENQLNSPQKIASISKKVKI